MNTQPENSQPPVQEPAAAPQSSSSSGVSTPLAVVIGLFVLIVVVGMMSGGEPKAPPAPAPAPAAQAPASAPTSARSERSLQSATDPNAPDPTGGVTHPTEDEDLPPLPPGYTREQANAMIARGRRQAMLSGGGGATNYNALRTTLKGVSIAEEIAMNDMNRYMKDVSRDFKPDPGITVNITEATSSGWTAVVSKEGLVGSCAMTVGVVKTPASTSTGLQPSPQSQLVCDPVK